MTWKKTIENFQEGSRPSLYGSYTKNREAQSCSSLLNTGFNALCLSEAELFSIYLDVTPGVWTPLAKHSEDSTLGCSFLFSRAGIKADLKIQYSYHTFLLFLFFFFFKYYEIVSLRIYFLWTVKEWKKSVVLAVWITHRIHISSNFLFLNFVTSNQGDKPPTFYDQAPLKLCAYYANFRWYLQVARIKKYLIFFRSIKRVGCRWDQIFKSIHGICYTYRILCEREVMANIAFWVVEGYQSTTIWTSIFHF